MIMLKLLPEQISRHWDIISFALENVNVSGEQLNSQAIQLLIEKLISGQVQCWAVHNQENGHSGLAAMVFTSILKDPILNIRNLLLMGIYVFDHPSGLMVWHQGLETLRKYAKGNDCQNIVFYTNVPDLIQMAKKFGAITEFTYGVISLT
jgi:hypothetical protein